jgi:ubiquinone/menaquinone biosynthesis C-methylase UbiE
VSPDKRDQKAASVYDAIAGFYDAWSGSVVEDIGFYVDLAHAAGGRVIELGVGTGRIAVPVAQLGIEVTGIDSSQAMLDLCAERATQAGVRQLLDLRVGDLRAPPDIGAVQLVMVPFRAYLHLENDTERLAALRAAFSLLEPGGQLVFDVFRPSTRDVTETHGKWLEREPGIWERADWDTVARELVLSVRREQDQTVMHLHWADVEDWRLLLLVAGFEVVAEFGWFDRRPLAQGEDMIWIARRPVDPTVASR